MKFLWRRLFERSTLTTLATLVTSLIGMNIAPELSDMILTGTIAILSAVGILTEEK